MRFTLRYTLLGVLFVSPVFPTPCAIGTLASYISLGSTGCTINGEIVDSFSFAVDSTSLGSPLTASAITVTPTSTATSYNLLFTATGSTPATGFTVSGTGFADYEIDFNWDPLVGGARDDMFASTPVFPGLATVTTNLCAGSTFGAACPPPTNTLFVMNNGISSIPNATTFFTSPVLLVGTESFIDLTANGYSSTITGFDTIVFITPEPRGMELVAAGFLALAWRRFRGRQPDL